LSDGKFVGIYSCFFKTRRCVIGIFALVDAAKQRFAAEGKRHQSVSPEENNALDEN
jgi:hypothetical protein